MFWISTKHWVPCLVLEAQGESFTQSHYSWGLNIALTLHLQFRGHLLAYLISSRPLCQTHCLGYLIILHSIAPIHMFVSWTHWRPDLYAIFLLNVQSWENMSALGGILDGGNCIQCQRPKKLLVSSLWPQLGTEEVSPASLCAHSQLLSPLPQGMHTEGTQCLLNYNDCLRQALHLHLGEKDSFHPKTSSSLLRSQSSIMFMPTA